MTVSAHIKMFKHHQKTPDERKILRMRICKFLVFFYYICEAQWTRSARRQFVRRKLDNYLFSNGAATAFARFQYYFCADRLNTYKDCSEWVSVIKTNRMSRSRVLKLDKMWKTPQVIYYYCFEQQTNNLFELSVDVTFSSKAA
jgi:hypothetical protein